MPTASVTSAALFSALVLVVAVLVALGLLRARGHRGDTGKSARLPRHPERARPVGNAESVRSAPGSAGGSDGLAFPAQRQHWRRFALPPLVWFEKEYDAELRPIVREAEEGLVRLTGVARGD
jgi:hypothetical protein